MSQQQVDKLLTKLKGTLSYDDFKDVDMVVEAVIENIELKQKIFAGLTCVGHSCKTQAKQEWHQLALHVTELLNMSDSRSDSIVLGGEPSKSSRSAIFYRQASFCAHDDDVIHVQQQLDLAKADRTPVSQALL